MNNVGRRATVCFLQKGDQVLLALIEYSPTDRKWNGVGGWAEDGESLEDAVVREVAEETFIALDKSTVKKVLEVHGERQLHVFLATQWGGDIKTKEPSLKELRWFSIYDLPFQEMWPGTDTWLPKLLRASKED